MRFKRHIILLNIITISLSCILLMSCRSKSMDGMLIITQVPGNIQHLDFITGESWRYMPEARIAVLDPNKPASLIVLTNDFYSACAPEISFDGKHMLFAAQQKEGESWQIWEMDLDNLKSRKVISCKESCIDPVYLPGDRLVFSKLTENDTVKTGHSLYTCNLDGSAIKQITFHPHANFATSVLKDGRLLTISRQLLPDQEDPILMVLRPDGTKADMFYQGIDGSMLLSCGRETTDGKIVFIEADKGSQLSGNVVSINYNRPLHTRVNLTAEIKGNFIAVLPYQSDKLLVSCLKSGAKRYALYEFDPVKRALGKAVYTNPEYDVLDAVVVEKHDRPKKLPSEVDTGVKTGLLLCQDINVLDIQSPVNISSAPKAQRIEVMGIDSSLGVVQVEKDGSFYLKVMADTPFQIRTIDENGHILNGPCDWIWLRPNERRGCVGCHEDPELVPENKVSFAVKKLPVVIPVHVSEVTEKEIELE